MLESKSETIYVSLLDEGTDVWRPVEAVQVDKNSYRITSPSIDDESWQFGTGSLVRCRERFSEETGSLFLEAYELVAE